MKFLHKPDSLYHRAQKKGYYINFNSGFIYKVIGRETKKLKQKSCSQTSFDVI